MHERKKQNKKNVNLSLQPQTRTPFPLAGGQKYTWKIESDNFFNVRCDLTSKSQTI